MEIIQGVSGTGRDIGKVDVVLEPPELEYLSRS